MFSSSTAAAVPLPRWGRLRWERNLVGNGLDRSESMYKAVGYPESMYKGAERSRHVPYGVNGKRRVRRIGVLQSTATKISVYH